MAHGAEPTWRRLQSETAKGTDSTTASGIPNSSAAVGKIRWPRSSKATNVRNAQTNRSNSSRTFHVGDVRRLASLLAGSVRRAGDDGDEEGGGRRLGLTAAARYIWASAAVADAARSL